VGFLQPALDDVFERYTNPVLVDCGSGNAYLGFILYELFLKNSDTGELLSVESNPELHARAKQRAVSLSYSRMHFVNESIRGASVPERIHVLTALHACDTATDDALELGLRHRAEHIFLVPCCQAELAKLLKDRTKDDEPHVALFKRAWHRREFGSHLSNVLRALVLEANGYKVTVTELVGWEHSLKNELILAKRVQREDKRAKSELMRLLDLMKVRPALIERLEAYPLWDASDA